NDVPQRLRNNPEAVRMRAIQQGVCQCGRHMRYELGMAAMALAAVNQPMPKDKDKDKPKEKDKDKLLDELVSQAIKEVVMHEYGHKPLSGGTEGESAELKKIASRGAEPGLDYGTDEDTFLTSDPKINRFDLGSDVMKFSQDRMIAAEELLKGLSDQVVEDGEG